jgi:hypothetical protein
MKRLIITGFNTQAEVDAFTGWYEGAGEQDASMWFEERKHDGDIDVSYMNSESVSTDGDDTVMIVTCV